MRKKRTWYWVTRRNSSVPHTVLPSFREAKISAKMDESNLGERLRVLRVTEVPLR